MKKSNVLSLKSSKRSIHAVALEAKNRLTALAKDTRGSGLWDYILVIGLGVILAGAVLAALNPAVQDIITGIINKIKSTIAI